MKILLFAGLLFLSACGTAQTDTTTLLKEAAAKLKTSPVSTSIILSDKNYSVLHPNTSFRELIKQYSSNGILTITTPEEPGKKIRVYGSIVNKEGKPVANALVYLYQTDTRGWYAADAPHVLANEGDMRHARLFGYVRTDKKGNFELHTIKPHGYPQSDLPAHIHIVVAAEGYRDYQSEFLFDDDERLVGTIREQAVRNRFIIGKPEKAPAPFDQQFSYMITLEH